MDAHVAPQVQNHKVCGLTALGFVGGLANFVRILVTFGLLIGGVVVGVVAGGWVAAQSIQIPLYIFMVMMFIGSLMVLFDASMAKYLVEVVLNRLSKDVMELERIESELKQDLAESSTQIAKRDKQLQEEDALLEKQRKIVSNNALQLASLKNALHTLLAGGHDMTAELKHEIDRLYRLAEKHSVEAFLEADANRDGAVDIQEWTTYHK